MRGRKKGAAVLLLTLSVLSIILLSSIIVSGQQPSNLIYGYAFSIGPGESYSVNITEIDREELVIGSVSYSGLSRDIEFWIESPEGTTIYSDNSSTSTEFILQANVNGTFTLNWKNNDELLSIETIQFGIYHDIPKIELLSPRSGGVINDKTPLLIGQCNFIASSIRISMDNVTFTDANIDPDLSLSGSGSDYHYATVRSNWTYAVNLDPGTNSIFVIAETGHANGTITEEFTIDVNTLWLYEENGESKIGWGVYLLISVVSILSIMALVIVIRKRN